MHPVTRPAEAEVSSSEYFLPLLTRNTKDLFALLRLPRSLTGTESHVPVSAVLDYDEKQFLPFDDDQLWLEPPKGKKQDKAAKTPKQLATGVASKELTVRPNRTPHFGAITPGVRDDKLLLSIKLVGDGAYWKDAKPVFSLRDPATQEEIAPLPTQASPQNPRVHEALLPLADKRILGKKVLLHGAVTVPGAQLWAELTAAPPAFSVPHECVPRLDSLEMDVVELTDATYHVHLRCHARHIPNGKQGTAIKFRIYEHFQDLADPVELKQARFRYDLPLNGGAQCDTLGRVSARLTNPELVDRVREQGRYRLTASVMSKDGKVLGFDVPIAAQDIGDTPRKAAGRLIWGKKVSEAFRKKVIAICSDLKIDPNDLMACMAFETEREFKANKKGHSSNVYGLIQFTAETAVGLGTNLEALKAMTELQQLDHVHQFMANAIASRGPLKNLSDVYMAILWQQAVGKPPDYVLFGKGTAQYKQNDGLDVAKKGFVTKADATAKVVEQYELGKQEIE
jgi:hypothetical protein